MYQSQRVTGYQDAVLVNKSGAHIGPTGEVGGQDGQVGDLKGSWKDEELTHENPRWQRTKMELLHFHTKAD